MERNASLERAKRIGTGVCFIVFPLVFVFAFAVHPSLLHPHLLSAEGMILRAHHAGLLQFGHVLVTLDTALLIVVAVHFLRLLEGTDWAGVGLVGAAMGVVGTIILAVDKGALCLTMTALDTLPEGKFAAMMPGLLAMYSHKGWLVLLWGIALLPLGFAVLAVALFKTRALPRWQSALFLAGVLLVAVPDGAEIVNLTASVLMAAALVPYGVLLVAPRDPAASITTAARQPSWTPAALPSTSGDGRTWPRQSCATCRRK